MTKKRRAVATKPWLFVLPVALGVVFLILDLIPGASWQGATALTVAGFGLGLLAAVAIEQQLSRSTLDHSAEELAQVAHAVSRQGTALASLTQLSKLSADDRVRAERWLDAYVQAMLANTGENEVFARAADLRVNDDTVWFDRLSEKKVRLGASPPTLLLGLTKTARGSITAIAYGEHAAEWWSSQDGREYFEANVAALDRGVRVRRVFVEGAFSSATTRQTWIDRVSEHLDARFDVGYVVPEDDTSVAGEIGDDTAIFDDRYLYRSIVLGPVGRTGYLTGDRADVQAGAGEFERLWRKCERRPPVIAARLRELSDRVTTVVARRDASDEFKRLLAEPDFLLEAFVRGMPPAFVKLPGAGPVHILESDALTRFQRTVMGSAEWNTDEVTADHTSADLRVVAEGVDRQLELATPSPSGMNHLIVTTKTLIHYNGERYVVGWYLPVTLGDGATKASVEWVAGIAEQVPVLCSPVPPYRGLRIHVGEAVTQRGFLDSA